MFKKILAATDGSSHADKAIELASGLAKTHDANLLLIHVLQHGHVPEAISNLANSEHLVEQTRHSAPGLADSARGLVAVMGKSAEGIDSSRQIFLAYGKHLLARAEHEARSLGLRDVTTMMEDGDPVDRILDYAGREQVDLIVVGTRGLSDIKGILLGSVSHKLIQLAPCTCISVK